MYYDMQTDKFYGNESAMESSMENIKEKYNCTTKSKLISIIKAFITEEIKQIKNNRVLMNKIEKFCKDNNYKFPSLELSYDAERNYFMIIDANQEIRIEFYTIVYNIAKKLKREYGPLIYAFGYEISNGEGDEGCIYLEEI